MIRKFIIKNKIRQAVTRINNHGENQVVTRIPDFFISITV